MTKTKEVISPKKVAFPRYAEYNAPIRYLLENGVGVKCVLPPRLTHRSLEIGAKYSPDFVCTPFKILLGNMIEAIEAGADTLVMVYGLCKLGYYGELQEQILRDLGFDFDFVNLTEYNTGKIKDLFKAAKYLNPKAKFRKVVKALLEAVKMAEYIDAVTAEYYKSCGFETEKGSYKKAFETFIADMYAANTKDEIELAYTKVKQAFAGIPTDKPVQPLRVGIVGEFYTAMDQFSNFDVELKLAEMGVEIHRWMNVSNMFIHYPGEKNLNVRVKEYCTYQMGPTSTANIRSAKEYAEQRFDGVIHIKSANCTPEIDVMPVLQNISADYKVPVLYLTYDAQTSDVGLMTRLEAFYDMISMRKKVMH
ncbi:MAG: hypothetical protein J1F63_08315 [Oscillospiraceae bacterium]|nr:hypothetical protein [Oscillospiraceae bacterium]